MDEALSLSQGQMINLADQQGASDSSVGVDERAAPTSRRLSIEPVVD